jgi:two-component system KDP operon response regulator KdpE
MNNPLALVVDDEPKLVRLVREILLATGFSVISTGDGAEAVKMVAVEQPDLLLLDIVLTGELDGYAVARKVRAFSNIPIIMLTAKVQEADLLEGFDAGADDYITKPFSSKELLARVQALMKRTSREETSEMAEIRCGDLQVNLVRRRVKKGGEEIHLTRTEYNLLHELATHRGQVLLHHQILAAVWGPEYRDDLDYLRAYIRYLRRKLEQDPANPRLIITVQGVGYVLECPENN